MCDNKNKEVKVNRGKNIVTNVRFNLNFTVNCAEELGCDKYTRVKDTRNKLKGT